MMLPQLIKVTLLPSTNSFASSLSTSTVFDTHVFFLPNEGFFGWRSTSICLSASRPLIFTGTVLPVGTARYLCATGSITCLLKFHILSHSMKTFEVELPTEAMNFFKPSIFIPLRKIPLKVGIRGSSHPSTIPS